MKKEMCITDRQTSDISFKWLKHVSIVADILVCWYLNDAERALQMQCKRKRFPQR